MENYFLRTELMLGQNAMDKLKNSKVAIFGLGGVGSYATEGIIRSGVGNIDIFDGDVFDVTNINRQLSATTKTIGLSKAKITKNRMLDINPSANINAYECFFCKENEKDYDFSKYSYIIDAIDTITSKILSCIFFNTACSFRDSATFFSEPEYTCTTYQRAAMTISLLTKD